MSRLRTLILSGLAVLMSLVLVGPLASPSGAAITGNARISLGTNTSNPLHVDNRVIFRAQDDGTGVFIESSGLSVAAGCNSTYFASSPKWQAAFMAVYDGNSNELVAGRWNLLNKNVCSPDWGIELTGLDTGFVRIVFGAQENVPGGPDKMFEYVWNLWPSGNSQLVSAAWYY